MSELPLSELGALAGRAWLVGGAIRDERLGRPTLDYDVVVDGDARAIARDLAGAARAHAFPLSEAFGAWRVIARDRSWQVDLTPLMGATLQEDLARRDLTVNAIARPIQGGELIDLFDGLGDLERRELRMVGPDAFAEDPLRVLRLARLVAELDFTVERETLRAAVTSAGGLVQVSVERVFAELKQIISCARAVEGLEAMAAVGATRVVLPELDALHGVEQSDYHHLDVYDHTMATVTEAVALTLAPGERFGALAEPLAVVLAEPLANELTRGEALRFGALLHDIAKPGTRAVSDDGRVTFFGHDRAGAELASVILTRLRASERLATYAADLARHHLRLGFLVHEQPLDRHAVYRYLETCEPVEVDVTLLSVADRLATLGRNAELAVQRHLALAQQMLGDALRWRAARPVAPIRGDRLAKALEIRPGPAVGELLRVLTEASYAGEVTGEADAIAYAQRWRAQRGSGEAR